MASDLDLEGQFMQHAEYDLLRIYLPRCEYPGEWLWAMPRTGLTLLPRGPKVPCK
jgi:hypothetical protein